MGVGGCASRKRPTLTPWCMIMSEQAYIIQRDGEGARTRERERERESMVETHLTPRSFATGARGSGRLWPRQVTRKKTDRRTGGGFPRLPGLRIILLDLN